MKRILVAIYVSLVIASYAKPPIDLPAGSEVLWRANEAVVAMGALQHLAIELNQVSVCPPGVATGDPACRPLLSDANVRIVGDNVSSALIAMRAVPTGWKLTASAALAEIETRLDAAGKSRLAAWLSAVRAVVTLAPIGGTE